MRDQNSQLATSSKAAFVLSKLEREKVHYQKEFRQYHIDFACGYLLSLIDDTHHRLHMLYGAADYTRDRDNLHKRLKNEGMNFITHVLPHLIEGLLSHLEYGKASFPQFRLQRGTNYPRFCRRMFEIVMNTQYYSAEDQAIAFDLIYSLSTSFKKLRGDPDAYSHEQQYRDFVKVDSDLGKIDFLSPTLEPIISSITTQWYNFAKDLSKDDANCIPRPGPGAVVGSLPNHARYAPSVMYQQLHNEFPYEEWFYAHPWDVVEQSREYLDLLKNPVPHPHSEWLLVPKTFLKWRGICKEANEVQYIQQALRRQLYDAIEKKLSYGIPIRDQSVHQKLALDASLDQRNATIDESEASDRIARSLVWLMTSMTPEYRSALMACSTKFIKPPKWASDQQTLTTHKFAPMGSAICFPIMSILHYFLVRAIILIYAPDRSIKSLHDLCNRVSVYGDDIVLPSSVVHLVYEWLPKFGMKINQTKSYVKSFFRESCGMHAYKGHDITPVYIKYTNYSSTKVGEAKVLASLIAAEELLFNKGKYTTAEFLRRHIDAKWPNLPYVSNVTPLVGYKRPPFHADLTDFSTLSRKVTSRKWDQPLQSFKYRLMCWCPVTTKGIIPSEEQAYLRYHCIKPRNDVSLTCDYGKPLSSFSDLDVYERCVDDESEELQVRRVPMLSSALYGHELKLDCDV